MQRYNEYTYRHFDGFNNVEGEDLLLEMELDPNAKVPPRLVMVSGVCRADSRLRQALVVS